MFISVDLPDPDGPMMAMNSPSFTSNDTPAYEYRKARELGAIINLDDISHIEYLEEHVGLPELICCRYNPGPLKGGNAIIGHPEDAKYGFTREQLFEGYRMLRDKGVQRFGLHTMVASNELEISYFLETAHMLFDLVGELSAELGIEFEFVNIGGGIGIPHGKMKDLDSLVLGFGLSRKGVDFESLDGKPAHIFFLLVTPENSTGLHLKLLARISRILKNEPFKDRLMAAADRDEILGIIKEEDEDF
jgi:hypothetical protein